MSVEPVEAEHLALRTATALTVGAEVAAVRLRGAAAFDALDRLVPAKLFIRDGQMLHSLLLHPDGHPVADLYVCCDDEDFILLAEGLTGAGLEAYAREHLGEGLDLTFEDLRASHEVLSLNGPWAWELLAEWLGPDVIGIPYLSFFHLAGRELGAGAAGGPPPGTCFRAGKTGEYGYDLLLRRDLAGAARQRVMELGAAFDLVDASTAALDQCSLENGFFDIRAGDLAGLTPLELQLQWRVSRDKAFVGSEALARRRAEGVRERLTTFVAPAAVARGAALCWEEREIGKIWAVGYSPLRGDWVGLALIERRLAHPGIDAFTAGRGSGAVPLRTLSAPVLNNRSLYVDPRRHSYRFRDDLTFPPGHRPGR